MYKDKSLFIDNKWIKVKTNDVFTFKNYKNLRIDIKNPKKDKIKDLVESSKKSFDIWKFKTNQEKSKILKIIANIILNKKVILARQEIFDTGKSYSQAIDEISYCYKLWSHASRITLNKKDKLVKLKKNTYCKIINEPIGVTSVIIPWNFPLLVMSERLPYILGAGCVGILKPSEYASAALIKFVELIKADRRVPKGIINLITGDAQVGTELVLNKNVKCISFTGSTTAGKKSKVIIYLCRLCPSGKVWPTIC